MAEEKRMRTLMQRLETAISRIEDIADFKSAVTLGEAGSSLPGSATGTSLPDAEITEIPLSIKEFDNFQEQYLSSFISASDRIGGLVHEQAEIVRQVCLCVREIISLAARSSKPAPGSEEYLALLKPLQEQLNRVTALKDSNRPSPVFSHLSTVADGIPAAGWVAVEPTPAPYISDMHDSAQFYANRVIKEYKEKDPAHVEWARSFLALLTGLKNYVKDYHTTGLTWNSQGSTLKSVLAESASLMPSLSSSKSVPPYDKFQALTVQRPNYSSPPGPPPPPLMLETDGKPAQVSDMNSVFADLNRGASVTSKLRKVDKTQMTHKNPALRASSVVPEHRLTASESTKAMHIPTATNQKKRSPRKELEGTKWIVENFVDDSGILIDDVEINHTVYVYNCRNSTLQIKGKFNALSVDSSVKVGIVVDSLVSSIDLVKTNSFALQILGKCPTIICDVCDSGQIYLAKEALDCELVTSKSNSINLNIPCGDDGQFKEEAVPEMLKHKIVDSKLETTIVVHAD